MQNKETTSNRKLAKKARQIFRKNQQQFWGAALKPKPKWVPWVIWGWLLGLVLKVEEKK